MISSAYAGTRFITIVILLGMFNKLKIFTTVNYFTY